MRFHLHKPHRLDLKNRLRGFTLIEILVAISILSILTAIAMPSFTATIQRFSANAIRDEMIASLQFARSEAIRLQLPNATPIRMTRTPAVAPCTATTTTAGVWTCGWQIYQDINNNQAFDAGDILIQQSTVPAGFAVTENNTTPQNTITIDRWGQYTPAPLLVIAPIISGTATASDPSANALCMGVSGKLTKVTHTSGDVACP